jgi:hypothetical protein
VLNVDIVIGKGKDISGYPSVDFLRVPIMEKVGMVHKNFHRMFSPAEKVSPIC